MGITFNGAGSYWWSVFREALWQAFVLLYKNPTLLLIGLLVAVVTAGLVRVIRGKEAVKEHLIAKVAIPFLAALITWALIVLYYIYAIPPTHLSQVQIELGRSRGRERAAVIGRQTAELQLQDERKSKSDESQQISQLRQQVENLSRARKVATAPGVNTTGEQHQCWLDNHFESPNPHVKESHSATTAIIHCNYKIDAPFRVTVKFDRDFLYGNTGIPSAGMLAGGSQKQAGNIFIGDVQMPSVPANQLITMTVEAPTDQFPRCCSRGC